MEYVKLKILNNLANQYEYLLISEKKSKLWPDQSSFKTLNFRKKFFLKISSKSPSEREIKS